MHYEKKGGLGVVFSRAKSGGAMKCPVEGRTLGLLRTLDPPMEKAEPPFAALQDVQLCYPPCCQGEAIQTVFQQYPPCSSEENSL